VEGVESEAEGSPVPCFSAVPLGLHPLPERLSAAVHLILFSPTAEQEGPESEVKVRLHLNSPKLLGPSRVTTTVPRLGKPWVSATCSALALLSTGTAISERTKREMVLEVAPV
jgi:hypothetical protein